MTLNREDLDKIFCMTGKRVSLPKLLLKAVAVVESGLDERAYRYEPGFYEKYLRDKPEWNNQDPAVISASYGLMQLMYTTAWMMGFRGPGEDLYNPVLNVGYGGGLLRAKVNEAITEQLIIQFPWLSAIEIGLARYNGGATKNPDEKGVLRNQKYVNKVKSAWDELKRKEAECAASE